MSVLKPVDFFFLFLCASSGLELSAEVKELCSQLCSLRVSYLLSVDKMGKEK